MLSALRKISLILFIAGAGIGLFYITKNYTNIPARIVSPIENQIQPKPVRIKIPAIHVDASMEDLGLNSDGTLAVPKEWENVGWYTGAPAPGGAGPAVMVGHLDSLTGKAVFWDLKNLKNGDEIFVEREDGSVAVFKAGEKETYSQDNFPTEKVYGPIDYAGLRLITCYGKYSQLKGRYSDNLVVYARLDRIN